MNEGALQGEVDRLRRELADALADASRRGDLEAEAAARLSLFEAATDMLPVGVVVATAPTGEIVFGNARSREIFAHETHHSADYDSYGEWVSYHEDGRRVESHEYPLSRVLRDRVDHAEIEVLYQRGDGERSWVRIIGEPLTGEGGAVIGAVVVILDIEAERALQAQKDRLIAELDHRVKNAFTTIKALAEQSLADPARRAEEAALLPGRIDAYARVHAALAERAWSPISLTELLAAATETGLADHGGAASASAAPADALVLAMVLHELCEAGNGEGGARLVPPQIRWSERDGVCELCWTERLGAPERYLVAVGFRRQLLTTFPERQLGAQPALHRDGEEVLWSICIPSPTQAAEAVSS